MHILNHIKIFFITIFFCNFIFAEEVYIINTTSGISKGVDEKGVITWHDLPYAQPPINDLRWKAPISIENELFIINDKKNNFCVQRPSSLGGATGKGEFVGTEDCLYLDIRKPKNSDKKLPVMFWIHGGGNTSGLKDIYDFSGLVKKEEVIVVSINYRLGPFGWFSHPSIQNFQRGLDKTSNFGTLDIIKALEWVNKNIEKFGGDKNNITIFGESAGGHNVLSMLVAPQAEGLFHKAISQSGYTTSINYKIAHDSKHKSIDYINSQEIIQNLTNDPENLDAVRSKILDIPAYEFYSYYSKDALREIPLMTNDGIVIPNDGLYESLKNPTDPTIPVIAGSNRDEVKLWIGTALYFIQPEYSFFGSIFGIPRIKITNPDAFEAFNYYRSSAWQLRGVVEPLNNLSSAGAENLFAYRYDWDDHRRRPIADFKKIIGAAHATEIPLIAGNNKLVGNYGFIIYPNGPSKRYASKNMMRFWANFAKTGKPGFSTNNIKWVNYLKDNSQNVMILDKKKNLKINKITNSYTSLVKELELDNRVNEREKCVILYQMGVLIGNDIYKELEKIYSQKCNKDNSVQFLQENSSFVSY